MDPLSLAVAVLAAVIGIARAVGMFRRNVNGAMFTRIAIEQINKGALDRVRRICEAVPRTAFPAVARAAIEATAMCDAEQGGSLVEQTIRDAFDDAYRQELESAAQWSFLAPIAVVLGAGALILAFTAPSGAVELALVPATLAVACGVWSIIIYGRIKRDPVILGESIVDALVDHVMRATGDVPLAARDPDSAADEISRGLGLKPPDGLGERTVPAGVTTIAATKARTPDRKDGFDMRRGNCGMCGHAEVATMPRGPLKAYICKGCGFAQWFADDPSSLDS